MGTVHAASRAGSGSLRLLLEAAWSALDLGECLIATGEEIGVRVIVERAGYHAEDPRSCHDAAARRNLEERVRSGEFQGIFACPPQCSFLPKRCDIGGCRVGVGAVFWRLRDRAHPWGRRELTPCETGLVRKETQILLWWTLLCGEMVTLGRPWGLVLNRPTARGQWSVLETLEVQDLVALGSQTQLRGVRGSPGWDMPCASGSFGEGLDSSSGARQAGGPGRRRVGVADEDVQVLARQLLEAALAESADPDVEMEMPASVRRERVRRI